MSNALRRMGAPAAALLLLALAGCATGTPAALDLPPSCGEYTLGQGESIPDEAVDCMAAAGEAGATLTVTSPTTEGDPILTVYTAMPDGSVEVYADMTEDRFGGGISVQICPEAVSVLDLGGCEEEPVD
ncbi:hypothetical protein [Microbacterium pumilum]|uniref:Uncharacterized protein n=1 Tax=Microbacterium pumilum TaxID=344165 RepID=A0ABN2SJ84_9MICO